MMKKLGCNVINCDSKCEGYRKGELKSTDFLPSILLRIFLNYYFFFHSLQLTL